MVSAQDAQKAAAKLDFAIPAGHENDYIELLKKTDDACRAVLAIEGGLTLDKADIDYKPKPYLDKFPRGDVHLPQENPLKAWAWRCNAGGAEGILSGKTVVLKDTVCMAGVPLLFGTNAFENYTRTSSQDPADSSRYGCYRRYSCPREWRTYHRQGRMRGELYFNAAYVELLPRRFLLVIPLRPRRESLRNRVLLWWLKLGLRWSHRLGRGGHGDRRGSGWIYPHCKCR